MEPPSYDQSIAEEGCHEDKTLYYNISISAGNQGINIGFSRLNSEGKTIEYVETLEVDFMSEQSKKILCTSSVYGASIHPVIDDLVRNYGNMRLLYGNIKSRCSFYNGWQQAYNMLNLTFLHSNNTALSTTPTMNLIHIPVEYNYAGTGGGFTEQNGYITIYYKTR